MYGNNRMDRGSFGDRQRQQSFAPVRVGEELDVTIEAVGEKGDGICKKKGFVLFVPNTKQGDNVKIRITKVLRKVGFAEVIGEGSGSSAEQPQETQEETAPAEEEVPQGEESEDFGNEEPEEPSEEEQNK